ncbi:hypothetical protein WJ32_18505 (plasmid) [Burkholderia ubonensis]|uniref:Flagellar basal-body/hook protein C-terminal domain-containing protein n=1 Tax=Burkholderia ubonensis TaxID=101571 RepID=A0A103RNH0_9BURK|nr:hypothetical protein WJ32_18505 [Burkholderia ubonensis]KVG71117.1 hypothetical protein WJ33_21225 [Burkholderia ubonensis]
MDDRGRLASENGWTLQAAGGGDLTVNGNAWRIAADGTVVDGGAAAGRVLVVDFSDRQSLVSTTGGFRAFGLALQEVESPDLRQGFLEQSNVSTADDMIQMMEAVRRAEAAQRLAMTADGMLGSAIRVIGEGQQ